MGGRCPGRRCQAAPRCRQCRAGAAACRDAALELHGGRGGVAVRARVSGRDAGRARQKEGKYCELERLGARSKPMRDGQRRPGRWLSCQRNSWVGMKLV